MPQKSLRAPLSLRASQVAVGWRLDDGWLRLAGCWVAVELWLGGGYIKFPLGSV